MVGQPTESAARRSSHDFRKQLFRGSHLDSARKNLAPRSSSVERACYPPHCTPRHAESRTRYPRSIAPTTVASTQTSVSSGDDKRIDAVPDQKLRSRPSTQGNTSACQRSALAGQIEPGPVKGRQARAVSGSGSSALFVIGLPCARHLPAERGGMKRVKMVRAGVLAANSSIWPIPPPSMERSTRSPRRTSAVYRYR